MGVYELTRYVRVPSANTNTANPYNYDLKVHAVDGDGEVRLAMVKGSAEQTVCYVKPDQLIEALIGLGLPIENTYEPPKGLGAVVSAEDKEGAYTFVLADPDDHLHWRSKDGWHSDEDLAISYKNHKTLSEGVTL